MNKAEIEVRKKSRDWKEFVKMFHVDLHKRIDRKAIFKQALSMING